MPFLVALLMAGAVALIVVGAFLPPKKDAIAARLSTYAIRPRTLEEIEMQQPFYDRVLKPVVMRISTLVGRYTPQSSVQQIQRDLMLAGNPVDSTRPSSWASREWWQWRWAALASFYPLS